MFRLESVCHEVCGLTEQVGRFILSERAKVLPGDVEVKGTNDFVTYVDKASEKLIIEGLHKLIPEAGSNPLFLCTGKRYGNSIQNG